MIDFVVTLDGQEPYRVTATSRDVLVWEKTGKGRSLAGLKDGLRMGDVYALAHAASRRQALFSGGLDEFEATTDISFDTETGDGEGEPDPTR